jgi:DNA-directed RNA polymerase subunit RPC12/RpoP
MDEEYFTDTQQLDDWPNTVHLKRVRGGETQEKVYIGRSKYKRVRYRHNKLQREVERLRNPQQLELPDDLDPSSFEGSIELLRQAVNRRDLGGDDITPYIDGLVDMYQQTLWHHRNRIHELQQGSPTMVQQMLKDNRRKCHLTRGKWGDHDEKWGCICSECGAKFELQTGNFWNFCPKCGAPKEKPKDQ